MFDASGAPDSDPASAGRPRAVYLMARLRSRQITMDEATELFTIMQGMLRSAQAQARSAPPPTTVSPGDPSSAAFPANAVAGLGEDALWMGILGLGVAAGLGSALIKRMHGEPPGRSPPVAPPSSP